MKRAVFYTVAMLVTFCASLFAQRKSTRKMGKKLLLALLMTGVIIAATIAADQMMGLSYFELSALALGLTVLAVGLFFPLLNRESMDVDSILRIVCWECAVVAGYSILTKGQTMIHSDTATATILAQSMLRHHELFPRSFNYANGDIWFLGSHLFVLLPSLLFNSQSLARMVASALYVGVTCLGIIFQSKKLFNNDAWLIAIPLFLVFLYGESDDVLYQASYTGQMLWVTLCSATLYGFVAETDRRRRWGFGAAYFLIIVSLTLCGMRMIAEQTIPALLACTVIAYLHIRNERKPNVYFHLKQYLQVLLLVVIPAIIGILIYGWLCTWHNVNTTTNSDTVFVDSVSAAFSNFSSYFRLIFECFGFTPNAELFSLTGIRNIVLFFMCLIVCFVTPVLQWKKLDMESEAVQFFYSFGIAHNLIMLLIVVMLGKTTAPRYLLTSVFVWILISSRYIYVYWLRQEGIGKYTWLSLFALASIVMCLGLPLESRGWNYTLNNLKLYSQDIENHEVEKAYATYWNAYNNEVYADCHVRFGALSIDQYSATPFEWLVDSDVFAEEPLKTCLLLNETEEQAIGDSIASCFGNWTERTQVGDKTIYYFDYDIAEFFCNGLSDGVIKPNELMILGDVVRERQQLCINKGGTSYGPYVQMEAGEYVASFYGKNLDECTFDIQAKFGEEEIGFEVINRNEEIIEALFVLENDVENAEFRVFNYIGDDTVFLYRIEVEEIKAG